MARSRGIDVKMWLTDLVSGEQITISKPIAFFRTEYTTPTVEFKLSEWPANNTIQVPFGNALAQIGVTADLFKQLSDTDPIPVSKSIGTKVTDDWDGKDGTPAIIRLENPHQKEAGNKAVTTPEEDYLKFVFFAGKPDAGRKIQAQTDRYLYRSGSRPADNQRYDLRSVHFRSLTGLIVHPEFNA